MDNLKLGDVEIRDDKKLGFSAYIGGERVMWINRKGEIALMKWIAEKRKTDDRTTVEDVIKAMGAFLERRWREEDSNPPLKEKK